MTKYDNATPINLHDEIEGDEQEWGWISISEFVTDGHMTWLETQRYLYYSPKEARALYLEHVKDHGWTIKEDV